MDEQANEHQGTLSHDELIAQMAADEAARDQPDEPETEAEEKVAEPEAKEEPKEPDEPKHEDEFEKRIARMAFEKRTAEKQARILQERLDRLEGKAPPLAKDDEMALMVEARAAQLAVENARNSKANAIYQAGLKEFPDFELKLAGLREMGGVSPDLVEAIDEAGEPHKIIHYLCRNLDEAERVLAMPPAKMGAAVAKIAAKLAAPPPKPISKAPPPIKPIGGSGKAELSDETMPLKEYMKREDERFRTRARR